jgi:hypothetical protein
LSLNVSVDIRAFIISGLCPVPHIACNCSLESGEVYYIQHYIMIKFVSDLRQVDGFLRVLWFPPPLKQTVTI